jgi:hypothetical protein
MPKNSRNICVIGTGPNSLVATKMLLANNFRVTVIDPSDDKIQGSELRRKFILKKRKNDESLFTFGTPLSNASKSQLFPIETRSFGGLTNLWGGVFFPPYLEYYEDKHRLTMEDFNELLELCRPGLKINETDAQKWNENLAHDASKEMEVLKLEPQLALNEDGKLWRAADSWQFVRSKNLRILKGVALSILRKDTCCGVKVRINSTSSKEFYFDHVFLGCGPIGNAKLILNSGLGFDEAILPDSGVSYHLTWRKNKVDRMPIIMQPDRCGFVLKGKIPHYYFQHYPFSVEMIESLRFSPVRFLAHAFSLILRNRIGLLMVFRNDLDSRSVKISFKKGEMYISELGASKTRGNKHAIIIEKRRLRNEGIRLLPIWFNGKAGEGVHSAGPVNYLKNGESYDLASNTNLNKNVHFLGMSATNKVFAGPVTYLSMTLSKKLVEEFILAQNN